MALAVIAVAGCGSLIGTQPPATPTDFPGLTARMKAAGIVIEDSVSGDAGCTDPDLVPASISFAAHGLDQAQPVRVRLYVFRNRAAWERHRDAIGPCAQSWVTDPATYEEIQESPYVLASQGPWAPSFEAAFRSAVTAAAGTGG
jgi:hypothetical protein